MDVTDTPPVDNQPAPTNEAASWDLDETAEEYEAAVAIRSWNAVQAERRKIAHRLQNGAHQDLYAARYFLESVALKLDEQTPDAGTIRQQLATARAMVHDALDRLDILEEDLRTPDSAALLGSNNS